jgi:DNA-binding response OmpR family regulator
MEKRRILLAEDDLNLGILLVDYLESEGYEVKLCKDGEIALKAFESKPFDLCLLDVMMPKLDGFELAAKIKRLNPLTPFIFITAKSLKEDKLRGYELGADDYIGKPFDEEELLWKIKAIERRMPAKSLLEPISSQLYIGKYLFDPNNQLLQLGSQSKRITEKECELLKYLYQHKNKVVKREDILTDLWGENDYFLGRSLDVFITKIRKYLKDDPSIGIENVFGVGFILNLKDSD